MNKILNDLVGYLCTFVGLALLASSLYLGSAQELKLSRTARIMAVTGTATTGGAFSFGLGRRLLKERVEAPRTEEDERDVG